MPNTDEEQLELPLDWTPEWGYDSNGHIVYYNEEELF